MSDRNPIGGELTAAITATPPKVAAAYDSAGKLAIATDPYAPADGILEGYETRADHMASINTPGRFIEGVAGATLTAGTHRALQIGANGRLYPLTAGARHFANWTPRTNETGATVSAEATDIIEVELVPDSPRPWFGSATVAETDSTVNVNVDAAFNGRDVVVVPKGGFDDTATTFVGAVAGGILTITANAAATADTDVTFIIDGGN